MTNKTNEKKQIFSIFKRRKQPISKFLLGINFFLTITYFLILAFFIKVENYALFTVLIFAEAFHLWQTISYLLTIINLSPKRIFNKSYRPDVDIFITVVNEPIEIVRETALAAKNLKYLNHKVYILNDGKVAGFKDYRKTIELAKEIGVECITRNIKGGAKAGNINHALKQTNSPLFVVFDADHVPKPNFLEKTIGYFYDRKVAFVQSPQYYKNHEENYITKTAWEQQELFFDPICQGKDGMGSTFMCGTNMVIRRTAVIEVGGMCETNIAEDFLTSLFIHEKGWKSIYVPEILAEGLAPQDFLSYYKQQFRWARGSLEVIFKYNPLFRKGLDWKQKFQYLSSASYYLSGIIIWINLLLPITFLFTGLVAQEISTMKLAIVFIPYIFTTIYILNQSNNFKYTFNALTFSFGSFDLFTKALLQVLLGKETKFEVTSKTKQKGNYTNLIYTHILIILISIIGFIIGYNREGLSANLITNISWSIVNITLFLPFIRAALPEKKTSNELVTIKSIEKLAIEEE
jgi:cellulose synthase (UDP-forming)